MISLSEAFRENIVPPDKTSLSYIFEEEPVDLNTFIKDKHYLNLPEIELSKPQYETIQAAERVLYPDIYPRMAEEFSSDYWATDVPMRNLFTVMYGKGGGKDFVCRVISLRIAHLLLCLRSPQEYFKMPSMDSIHLLNIAANAPQAYRAFFKPMTDAVKHPWFKDKAQPKKQSIQYAKNIEAISGHSDADGQEGLNLMLGVADEIDAFPSKSENRNTKGEGRESSTSAETILDMLRTSSATRFPETYKRVAISFPRYLGSPIMRQIDEANKSIKKNGNKTIHYVSGPYATWEVNPRVSGKEHFAEHYESDPVQAQTMYECKPTRAIDPYFKNFEIFTNAVDRDKSPLTIRYELETVKSMIKDNATTTGWMPKFEFDPAFQPVQGARYSIHGDLAVKGDRAGIAMSHVEKWVTTYEKIAADDGEIYLQERSLPIVKVDFVVAFEADLLAKPSREIQIRWARDLAFELIKRGFLVQQYTFDGFQSVDSIQLLAQRGIESKRVSADINDNVWKNLRDVASEGRLKLPYDALLMDELESLSKIRGKVDHPPHKSKDLADALACSVQGAIELGGEEDADGKMIDLGEQYFDVGEADAPLYGYEMTSRNDFMPIGMSREEHYGYF